MSVSSPPNLGNVITSDRARKIIYGVYVIAAVLVGAAAVYFSAVGQPIPEVITGLQAVIAYLAIPVGALALANVSAKGVPFGDGEGLFK